jgi:hypothetical protein
MLLTNDFILPAELTGYVRAGLGDQPLNQFSLARFLPNRLVDDLEYRYTKGGEGLVEAAKIRTYDAEATIGGRPGTTRVTGELPPISRKIRLSEYDRLRLRQDPSAAIRNGLMDDGMRMARSIAARVEQLRGEALYSGKLQINENGVVATVDFGRAAGHTVTTGVSWATTGSADPLTDLQSWRQTYNDANGADPGAIVTSLRGINFMLQNQKLRDLAASNGFSPSILSEATLNQLFAAYGLPPIYRYDVRVNVDGVATRVIPDDKLLLLPAPVAPDDFEAADWGGTFWGTTSEALDPRYGIEPGEEAGIAVGSYSTEDPIAIWTKASAIVLPVLANPDLTFCADLVP